MKQTETLPPPLSLPPAGGVANDRHAGTTASAWLANRAVPLLGMSAAIVGLLGLPVAAHAAFIPPTNGPYRLLFVTSTATQATSTDISTYNSFVTTAAGLNASLPDTSWAAIVSTAATSALSNVDSICSTVSCQDAPIYLVDGTLVASSQSVFFGGTLAHAPDETETGAAYPGSGLGYVWTGSTSSGGIDTGHVMGSPNVVEGWTTGTNNGSYLNFPGFTRNATSSLPLYAISGEVGVPEPASGALLLVGGVATGLVRRRRKQRRSAA